MKNIGTFLLATLLMVAAHANTIRIGNGGDTTNDGHLSIEALKEAIYNSNRDLQLLLHAWIKNTALELPALSTQEKVHLLTVVRNTPVDLIGDEACHDGINKKDAVAYSQPTNKVCVSLFQLRTKLNSGNYKNQILALMIHEYSHLIGFDEARAEKLQVDTLQYFNFFGYPVPFGAGFIDDFELFNPYSRFEGLWRSRTRLSEEIAIYTAELKEKMADYATHAAGNYPTLPPQLNYTGDIMLRLNYLTLVNRAYWQTPSSRETRAGLERLLDKETSVDLVWFNNSDLNLSLQPLLTQELVVPVINNKTPESEFRDLILQIDALKRQMEVYMLSVLSPKAAFTYYSNPSGN